MPVRDTWLNEGDLHPDKIFFMGDTTFPCLDNSLFRNSSRMKGGTFDMMNHVASWASNPQCPNAQPPVIPCLKSLFARSTFATKSTRDCQGNLFHATQEAGAITNTVLPHERGEATHTSHGVGEKRHAGWPTTS